MWGMLIWILGLGPALAEMAGQRTQINPDLLLEDAIQSPAAVLISRVMTTSLVYLLVLCLMWRLKTRASIPRKGAALALVALGSMLGPILSAAFGAQPNFHLNLLYMPLTILLAWLLPAVPVKWFVAQVKRVVGIFLYGSLVSAVVAPAWATSPYASILPGVSFRLHGLAPQANFLGPMAVLYLILGWADDRPNSLGWFHRSIAVLVLILSQSKTAWVIALAVYALQPWRNSMTLSKVITAFRLLTISVAATLMYGFSGEIAALNQFGSLETLSGRTRIWADTMLIWKRFPWFGYGPDLWSVDQRLAFGGIAYVWVGQAHNQFLQTLAETGLIGMSLFVFYVLCLIIHAAKTRISTNGVSAGLVVMMLLRSLTETPFRIYGVNGAMFMHLVVFAVLLLSAQQSVETPSRWMDRDTASMYVEAHG
jgi:O-antigen ligase